MTTLLTCAFLAAEIVTLTNGFQIVADRHEIRGDQIALIVAGGETVLPRAVIASFEELAPAPEPELTATLQSQKSSPPDEPSPKSPQELVREAAIRNGLPPSFVEAVARQESAFNPAAVSHKGAIGLMQLMPATAKSLGADPLDPEQNSEAGARHLRELLLQYQDHPDQVRRALAAYNAGSGAVKKYNGVPPYRETQNYVERVLGNYRKSTAATQKR